MSRKVEGDPVRIPDAHALRGSAKAVLVKFTYDDREVTEWFPLSQVDDDSEVWKAGDRGTLIISRWLAVEKGLVDPED